MHNVTASAVGKVDGRGYDGQQKDTVLTFVGHAKQFEAYSSQFFADFEWLVKLKSCLDA